MAEEDNEVLDWGNEDDVVSLGDENEQDTLEDPALATQNGSTDALSAPNASAPPSRSLSVAPATDEIPTKAPDQKPAPTPPAPEPIKTRSSPAKNKITIPTPLTHALPAKPATTNIPYVPPSDPSIVEATAMSSQPKKVDSTGHEIKDGGRYDQLGPLPPQWEIRFSRDKPNTFYYYDVRHEVSQWDRPQAPSSGSGSAEPPQALSHGDRHYRPDTNTRSTGRRQENSNEVDSRHSRRHSGPSKRSPERGRERSRSPSPSGRESRARGNQRSARNRGHKPSAPQRESSATEIPKDADRHWAPSVSSGPSANPMSRSARRQQNRAQTQSTDERIPEPRSEDVARAPLHREPSARDYDRDKERPFTPDYPSSNIMSTTRSATPPPPQEESDIIYQTHAPHQPRRDREMPPERARSPAPAIDPAPPPHPGAANSNLGRRDRPSRFGPEPGNYAPERANGLPMKPVSAPAPNIRSEEFNRADNRRPERNERRIEQDRDYEDVPPEYAIRRSPVQAREQDRFAPAPLNDDRDRNMPNRNQNPPSAPTRKRQPLPPQDAEFRGAGRSKPSHQEPPQRHRDAVLSSPSFNFQSRDKAEKAVDSPLPPHQAHRAHPGRDEPRQGGPGQPPSGPRDRSDFHDRDRQRGRGQQHQPQQRTNDQGDGGRNYDMAVDPPPVNDGRSMYLEREREREPERERGPPLKPRAMQADHPAPPAHTPTGPASAWVPKASRYPDRQAPPHLQTSDSRRDNDVRSNYPPQSGRQDRREPTRGPRGAPLHASSANSIPIGTRRNFAVSEPAGNDYPSGTGDRYERAAYPTNEAPRQARNQGPDYARSYPQQEPATEPRLNHPRAPREDSFDQAPLDDRGRRGDRAEPPRNAAPSSSPQEPVSRQPRSGRFASNRNSRFDPPPVDPLPPPLPLPPQQTWSAEYETSPRGQFSSDSGRDATPPPVSREPSYSASSQQWDSTTYPPRNTNPHGSQPSYRENAPQQARMDVDPVSNGRAPPSGLPAQERYRRQEPDFEGHARPPPIAPPPRSNSRRDPASYSPEARRALPPHLPPTPNGTDRNVGPRSQWDPTSLSGLSVEDTSRDERPRLNDRISGHPLPMNPELRSRKQSQGRREDNGYNGEPNAFEARASGRTDIQQHNQPRLPPNPTKTFEQRLDPNDRPPMPRGGSLLSRISHGGNDLPPPPPQPSLRDRVQVGSKRDRNDMVRGHFPDTVVDTADDVDADPGSRKGRKRRRARRGGGPA